MKKKNLISLVLFTVFCVFSVFSQDKGGNPNFIGNWYLDLSSSAIYLLGLEQMDANFRKAVFNCNIRLIIEYNEPELKIKQNFDCEDDKAGKKTLEKTSIYFTDERGETNQNADGDLILSTTKLDGNKIVTTFYDVNAKGKKNKLYVRRLSLSKNEDKITEIVSADSNYNSGPLGVGGTYTKRIYRKKK